MPPHHRLAELGQVEQTIGRGVILNQNINLHTPIGNSDFCVVKPECRLFRLPS